MSELVPKDLGLSLPESLPSYFDNCNWHHMRNSVLIRMLSFLYSNQGTAYTKKEIAINIGSHHMKKIDTCLNELMNENFVKSSLDERVSFLRKLYTYNPEKK